MSIAIGTIITLGVQVGTSIINQKYNKLNNEKIKTLQRESRVRAQQHDFIREKERLLRSREELSCIELRSHQERMEDIESDFNASFSKMAHKHALANYPLSISPYIIRESIIAPSPTIVARRSPFCVLTCSNDDTFNRYFFPILDRKICEWVSKYWNANSTHTLCYYDGAWNSKFQFQDEYITNLKAIIKVPTIVITPFLQTVSKGKRLSFKINTWGNDDCDELVFEPTPDILLSSRTDASISIEDIESVINLILPGIIGMIGFYIDNYYWATYYEKPILPKLLSERKLILSDGMISDYAQAYADILELYITGKVSSIEPREGKMELLHSVSELNISLFPERPIDLIDGIAPILRFTGRSSLVTEWETLLIKQIAEARTGIHTNQLQTVFLKTPFTKAEVPLLVSFLESHRDMRDYITFAIANSLDSLKSPETDIDQSRQEDGSTNKDEAIVDDQTQENRVVIKKYEM